jgi:hypothetical protein
MLIADEAYVPILRRVGAAWDDAMVARWTCPREATSARR